MAIWNRLTSLVAGGAVARAAADAAAPEFEVLKQTANRNAPYKVLDPATAAGLRARQPEDGVPGIDQQGVNYADDAARGQVGPNRFDLLTELARTMPGVAQLIALRRRNQADPKTGITDAEMTEALRRSGYTADHIAAIHDLVAEPLDPGQLAAAIHRGLIPDSAKLLRGQQPEPPFNVEAYPVYDVDAVDEALKSGYDTARLGVLVGLQGLPMGVIEAAQAYYRGIITHGDYIRAFNESNNRNEWAASVLEYARQIPTARDFMENALRGHHDFDWAAEQAARHGMSRDDAFLIYQNQGRPLNLHQITQAIAWGAKYNPGQGDNPDPWMQAVLLGAVRPEYYEMQDALKYNLPSAFFFGRLQSMGALSPDEAVKWYLRLGWPPELARLVADAFGAGSTSTKQTHTEKAQTQLWTATHTAYKNGDIDDVTAGENLTAAGVPTAEHAAILELWARESATPRKRLTAAQVKKAWVKANVNDATGQPWTQDEAVEYLVGLGYSVDDARSFLNIG